MFVKRINRRQLETLVREFPQDTCKVDIKLSLMTVEGDVTLRAEQNGVVVLMDAFGNTLRPRDESEG